MYENKRLTTENPKGNLETMLNFAYAKNERVYLRYGDKELDLCEVVSQLATENNCNVTPQNVMDGFCLECDESMCGCQMLYAVAVQAAELRERLKFFEDLNDQNRLMLLPCAIGEKVYIIGSKERNGKLCKFMNAGKFRLSDIPKLGKTVFPENRREEAERILDNLSGEL